MKLMRVGPIGQERPAILDQDGVIRDLSEVIDDLAGAALGDDTLSLLRALDLRQLPRLAADIRIGAPVAGVGKIICIGLNYSDHAAEAGMAAPDEPILFLKSPTALGGPHDPVLIPPGATKTDWEAELAVVIGRRARQVAPARALEHVAGYTIMNDVSERAFQLEHGGQWTKGKSCDSFAPLGPWLVTRDAVPDPQALAIWLELDDHRYQDGSTSSMIFGVAELVAYLSRFMTLEPGDVIATGTPAGVGMGQKPPVFLRPGQVMRLGIDGLGEQRLPVRATPAARPDRDG